MEAGRGVLCYVRHQIQNELMEEEQLLTHKSHEEGEASEEH